DAEVALVDLLRADEVVHALVEEAYGSVACVVVVPLEREIEVVRLQRHELRVRGRSRRRGAVEGRSDRAELAHRGGQVLVRRARYRLAVRQQGFQVVPQRNVEIEARQDVVVLVLLGYRGDRAFPDGAEVVVVLP